MWYVEHFHLLAFYAFLCGLAGLMGGVLCAFTMFVVCAAVWLVWAAPIKDQDDD